MGPYMSLFVLMDFNGSLSVLIGPYGSLSDLINPYVILWVFMGFYKSLVVLMCPYGSL